MFDGVDDLVNTIDVFGPKPFLKQAEAEYDAFVGAILMEKFSMW